MRTFAEKHWHWERVGNQNVLDEGFLNASRSCVRTRMARRAAHLDRARFLIWPNLAVFVGMAVEDAMRRVRSFVHDESCNAVQCKSIHFNHFAPP
jgi:hypothetical protein